MAKAKKAAKAAGKKAASKGEVLVVASKVRHFVRSKNVNMSSEVIGALNGVVQDLLAKAVKRTADNKRKTLRPQDL
jgi:hypothetical protein